MLVYRTHAHRDTGWPAQVTETHLAWVGGDLRTRLCVGRDTDCCLRKALVWRPPKG